MTKFFNPLTDGVAKTDEPEVSTSSLMNGTLGECPKCKQPFGTAIVNSVQIFYCEKCRVSQPTIQ